MARLQYMKPVAVHRDSGRKLMLLDDDGRWFLWLGIEKVSPVLIPEGLAEYLLSRPELIPLEGPRMWFAVADLPVVAGGTPEVHIPSSGAWQ
jgi:hypothetical protein